MKNLSDLVAKKIGLSKYEIDAILKVALLEVIENVKEGRSVQIEYFGYFSPKITSKGLDLIVFITDEMKDKLNENNNKERKDEIVFE